MRIFSTFAIIGLATIVAQTTILRLPLFQGVFYDLLIPMVVFLRLTLPTRKAIVLLLTIGFVMDLFSGGQVGLYLTIYFWLFMAVKAVSNYIDVQGTMSRSMLIALCVLTEHLTLFVIVIIQGHGSLLPVYQIGPVVWQVIFAGITGPAIVIGLERIHRHVQASQQENEARRQGLVAR